jgi:hypothetical protein
MKKDSTNTLKRMKDLTSQIAIEHETVVSCSLEIWEGGCFKAQTVEFRLYVKDRPELTRTFNSLEEMEASYDSTT